ncbi:MAG: multicopper oxidase domain-containing protein, partial [Deltaproteobacteria bacterium]|nr:multicopper oxidase domain-containing protein [Deltaproteobacteria bacterium]
AYDVEAADPDPGDILGFSLDVSPTGMTINGATGLIQWTPTSLQVGPNAVTVRVTDNGTPTGSATQAFTITVSGSNPPTITSLPGLAATEGLPYSYNVNANDLDPGDVLTFSLAVFPTGMTINPGTGLIQWTPASNQSGDHTVTVQVTDLGGLFDTQTFTITVAEALNSAPVITSLPTTTGTEDIPYRYDVLAMDSENDGITFSLDIFPAGMAVNPGTGVILWTPAIGQAGDHAVTVRATDNNSLGVLFSTQSFTISVRIKGAGLVVQCPGDTDFDSIPETGTAKCLHVTGGDGFVKMADGRVQYMFGFADVTGIPKAQVMDAGMLAGAFPAPTIMVDEGDDFYLNLTNVGMLVRPDLFDPHTIHWHGFPQASAIFDGVPDSSISINMGATLTYYYKVPGPGTYMWHCHVEATEHMQMGMLGNLYVKPAQDGTLYTFQGKNFAQFAYNDGDGSTGYDVDFPIQVSAFDPEFHDASETIKPLPFALMKDTYFMINGRGYPDTVNPNPLPAPGESITGVNATKVSQPMGSLIEAAQGQRILLRLSNINITVFNTIISPSIPMQVVGLDAKHLVSTTGEHLYYMTNSVTLGGGMTADVILDTTNVVPGTYFLYTADMNYLSNNEEDFGGAMTEIVISPSIP